MTTKRKFIMSVLFASIAATHVQADPITVHAPTGLMDIDSSTANFSMPNPGDHLTSDGGIKVEWVR